MLILDISHVSPDTMADATPRLLKAPVIIAIPRTSPFAPELQAERSPTPSSRRLPKNGGVAMVNFYSAFVLPAAMEHAKVVEAARKELREKHPDAAEFRKAFADWRKDHPMPRGTVATVADHIDHIVKVAGIDHVGLGSDFDGITAWPVRPGGCRLYPRITEELLSRGFTETDIHKILGGNALRALRRAGEVARELQKTTKPEVDQPKNVPRD